MPRVYVLLGNAGDGNTVAGAIPANSHRRRQPLHVADNADMTPWNFVLDKGIDDDVALIGRSRTTVEMASPFDLNTPFDIVQHVVLVKQLRSPHTLTEHEPGSEKQIATRVLDALPLEASAETSMRDPA